MPATDTVSALIDRIISTHHRFVVAESARILALFESHPELGRLAGVFGGLSSELAQHMMKEERILFPYIRQMESHTLDGGPRPASCFGTVRNPICMMEAEHEVAQEALSQLRQLSDNYTASEPSCQSLYTALAAFDADLLQHIDVENNVLFPRAMEMERVL
jgi:regulator of cell morphogenesis and NO signaling